MANIGLDLATTNPVAAVLRGKVLPEPRGGGHGDLHVRIQLQVAQHLSPQENQQMCALVSRSR
jgi:DnaJ-class molecular chaperone